MLGYRFCMLLGLVLSTTYVDLPLPSVFNVSKDERTMALGNWEAGFKLNIEINKKILRKPIMWQSYYSTHAYNKGQRGSQHC